MSHPSRCNVLWIFIEDMSPWMSPWGDYTVATPNIDRLCSRGVTYTNCFSVAPVCSPSRSGLITGCYPTRIGVHNHVASRLEEPAFTLPEPIQTLSELFNEAGYFCYNQGKDDYNFIYDRDALYHGAYETPQFYGHHHKGSVPFDLKDREWNYWRHREMEQPFFGQIGLWGGKNSCKPINRVDRSCVQVPAYYPDTEAFREEIARHYECIELVDWEVGQILDALEREGLLEETAIFLFSDHGMGALRHKQFCYDGGTHVPLIVSHPQVAVQEGVDDRLVSSIDIAAASLAQAGIPAPQWMDGMNFLELDFNRDYVVSARDRCDFTIDRIRSVRTHDFRYIRNFHTDRPLMQPQYRDQTECFKDCRRLFQTGDLSPNQAAYAGDERLPEELYDHRSDPDEMNNLAADSAYTKTLLQLRQQLDAWIVETDDQGRFPERPEQLLALIERWGAERCLNPEYLTVKKIKAKNLVIA
ncbi:sulfatase family protein [Coraliomargarita sp. W4R53]